MSYAEASSSVQTSSPGQLPGTGTNDNAAAGKVGEYISSTLSTASAVSLTTATPANVTSISLTPGDWDIIGNALFTGTAVPTGFAAGLSITTAAFQGFDTNSTVESAGVTFSNISGFQAVPTPIYRVSFSVTTTVFFVAQAKFPSGTCSVAGTVRARRVR